MADPPSTSLFYTGGDGGSRPLADRPDPIAFAMDRHDVYLPGADVIRAVNVAVLLGMPLLLTGAPGVGKTRLAGHFAEEHKAPFRSYVVTSISTARDLLYSFDELGRMREVFRRSGETPSAVPAGLPAREDNLREYLTFRPLGEAILRAGGPDAPLQVVPGSFAERQGLRRFADLFAFGTDWQSAQPTVVLIDEIDKAPRDLPNDLLGELDRMRFEIPELGVSVDASRAKRPVVFITSNSERALPEPFLRRCVYHHIAWPADRLETILSAHVEALRADARRRRDVVAFTTVLRNDPRIGRPPGLAEVIQWSHLLTIEQIDPRTAGTPDRAEGTLGVLLKTEADLKLGRDLLAAWRQPGARPDGSGGRAP